jgi:4-hydroxymandelate oxidase
MKLLTVADYRRAARAKLSPMAWRYFRSGADAEETLRDNVRAWSRWQIWPRVLVDVAERDLSTTILGAASSMPIMIAPTAYHKLAHADGELGTVRAAASAGVVACLATLATTSLEACAEATSAPKWFQLYVHRDVGLTRAIIARAEAAGYGALAVTVDTPLLGRRLGDERHGFQLPPELDMPNLATSLPPTVNRASALAHYFAERHAASFDWRALGELRASTKLPIVLKGVMRGDDAKRAVDHGCAAIVVSNHGGRQLDGVPATIDALPEVVDAVAGRVEVLVDGGVRWGTDVLKALALGARAVLLGRPILWGLAVDGEAGVHAVLEILRGELSRAMALAGCRSLREIDRELVRPRQTMLR